MDEDLKTRADGLFKDSLQKKKKLLAQKTLFNAMIRF